MLKVLGAMKSCNVDDWHNDVYNLDKTKRQWLTRVINFMREKRGALGVSVLRFWSLLRSVFRFLHGKIPGFSVLVSIAVFGFSFFDIRVSVNMKKKSVTVFGSCEQLAHCTNLLEFSFTFI